MYDMFRIKLIERATSLTMNTETFSFSFFFFAVFVDNLSVNYLKNSRVKRGKKTSEIYIYSKKQKKWKKRNGELRQSIKVRKIHTSEMKCNIVSVRDVTVHIFQNETFFLKSCKNNVQYFDTYRKISC